MHSPEEAGAAQVPDEIPPAALLQLPADWFNVLEDGDNVPAAQRRYESMVERVFPALEPEHKAKAVECLLAWREMIWSAGLLTHGFVVVPANAESGPILWQILVTLVKVPPVSMELDISTVLAEMMESNFAHATSVGTFPTALGLGAGFIARTPVPQEMRFPGSTYTESGSAAAIACSQGGGWGILVMGVSHDPDQAEEVAYLVGQVAGHSTLEPQDDTGGQASDRPEVPSQMVTSE